MNEETKEAIEVLLWAKKSGLASKWDLAQLDNYLKVYPEFDKELDRIVEADAFPDK